MQWDCWPDSAQCSCAYAHNHLGATNQIELSSGSQTVEPVPLVVPEKLARGIINPHSLSIFTALIKNEL
jgi:hypothetical protein